MIRMAMIGCGNMAGSFLSGLLALNGRLQFTALVDVEMERAERACESVSGARAMTDYHEALEADDVDAVLIALPHHLHHQVAMDAMRAGKHVLLEKPAAISESEMLELCRVEAECDVVLMIGYVMRYDPLWIRFGELMAGGTVGDVFHVSVWTEQLTNRYGTWGTNASAIGGGQLFSHGCHYIDLLLHWLGRPVEGTHVGSRYGTPWMEMEGTSNVSMRFESGATAYHFGTWGARGSRLKYAVHAHGTEGMLELNHAEHRIYLHRDRSGGDLPALQAKLGEGGKLETPERAILYETPDEQRKATNREIGHFLDCVAGGDRPTTSIDQSLQSLRVIWRLYQAERRGRVADLRGLGLDSVSLEPDPVLCHDHAITALG